MSREILTCSVCGNLFVNDGGNDKICSDCRRSIEQQKSKIETYLQKNPNSKIIDIADHTGISMDVIKRVIGGKDVSYPCKKCGSPIIEGKYCSSCKRKFRDVLSKADKIPRRKALSVGDLETIINSEKSYNNTSRMEIVKRL